MDSWYALVINRREISIFSEYNENKLKSSDFFESKKEKTKKEKNVLVFDFGRESLDLSLINVSDKMNKDGVILPKVLAVASDTELGGDIIDFIFTEKVLKILCSIYEDDSFIKDVSDAFSNYYHNYINKKKLELGNISNDVKDFILCLKYNLEQVKIKLSKEEKADIIFDDQYDPISITREDFEKVILQSDDLNIKDKIITALSQISKKHIRISEVLLVGGSFKIPYIKNIVVESFESMGITKEFISFAGTSDFNQAESIVARGIELEYAGVSQLFIPMDTEYPEKTFEKTFGKTFERIFEKEKEFVLKIGHSLSEKISLIFNELIIKGDITEKQHMCTLEFFLPVYYTDDDIIISMNIDEAGLYQVKATHKNTGESVEFMSQKNFSF